MSLLETKKCAEKMKAIFDSASIYRTAAQAILNMYWMVRSGVQNRIFYKKGRKKGGFLYTKAAFFFLSAFPENRV